MSRRTAPPGGSPPPSEATFGGCRIDLVALAEPIADAYFACFPEDLESACGDRVRWLGALGVLTLFAFAPIGWPSRWRTGRARRSPGEAH